MQCWLAATAGRGRSEANPTSNLALLRRDGMATPRPAKSRGICLLPVGILIASPRPFAAGAAPAAPARLNVTSAGRARGPCARRRRRWKAKGARGGWRRLFTGEKERYIKRDARRRWAGELSLLWQSADRWPCRAPAACAPRSMDILFAVNALRNTLSYRL